MVFCRGFGRLAIEIVIQAAVAMVAIEREMLLKMVDWRGFKIVLRALSVKFLLAESLLALRRLSQMLSIEDSDLDCEVMPDRAFSVKLGEADIFAWRRRLSIDLSFIFVGVMKSLSLLGVDKFLHG